MAIFLHLERVGKQYFWCPDFSRLSYSSGPSFLGFRILFQNPWVLCSFAQGWHAFLEALGSRGSEFGPGSLSGLDSDCVTLGKSPSLCDAEPSHRVKVLPAWLL